VNAAEITHCNYVINFYREKRNFLITAPAIEDVWHEGRLACWIAACGLKKGGSMKIVMEPIILYRSE
jgi:hypothetical protein